MSSIPEGFTSVTPYVVMDDTAAAIEFYKKALGAEEIMRLPAPDGNVMYAEILIGNARMMMGLPCPEWGGKSAKSFGGSPVSFFVYVENVEATFKKAKDAGMSVKKEIEDMFWGDRMGTLTDPFDVDWTIAQHIRDVSPEEMQEAMKNMNC
jgi:PhnB protein